jgi:hypothetical protein
MAETRGERLEDLDGGLAQPDARLGVGDRGGLASVASVTWLAGAHCPGRVEGVEHGRLSKRVGRAGAS